MNFEIYKVKNIVTDAAIYTYASKEKIIDKVCFCCYQILTRTLLVHVTAFKMSSQVRFLTKKWSKVVTAACRTYLNITFSFRKWDYIIFFLKKYFFSFLSCGDLWEVIMCVFFQLVIYNCNAPADPRQVQKVMLKSNFSYVAH